MFLEFQEISSVSGYDFQENSYFRPSMSIEKDIQKPQKFTVSQELLNEIIAVRSYSIKEISEETKIPVRTLHHIKSGTTKNPKFPTFRKIFGLYCQICQ